MKKLNEQATAFISSALGPPLVMLAVCVLAYGLLAPSLGFYWDDLPMSWIRYELGPEALTRYFSTNRPVWGILYQVTTRILPHQPFPWQVFALFWRWMTAVLAWMLFRRLWPGRHQAVLMASLFFLIYPGFNQQWGAYLYSHFFIVISFFLFSYLCMLWAFRQPRWFWPLTLAGMLFSALNLWMMEYFFVLELIRPVVIFFYWLQNTEDKDRHSGKLLKRTLVHWLPYLGVFLAGVYWRMFVFSNQIYQTSLLSGLKSNLLANLALLAKTIVLDLWTVSVKAWSQVFHFPNPGLDGWRVTTLYGIAALSTLVIVTLALLRLPSEQSERRSALWMVGIGMTALLTAGWPLWLTKLEISLAFPASRFTLPFMLGISLVLAGLLSLLPRIPRLALAVILIALASGRQSLWADSFRRDWTTQKALFWQMSWRIPGLEPNTLVLINEDALNYYADNSLAVPLNWIYAPQNRSEDIPYMLLYPSNRLGGSLAALDKGLPVTHDFIAGRFEGNTSQTVVLVYSPPACLRVLDPLIDDSNHFIPEIMREAAHLSDPGWIQTEGQATMPEVYAPEPAHGWCYYFEQADLARQRSDWDTVAALGNKAFALDDHPNDPVERFVFIEGYAHIGDWERARKLSLESYRVSKNYVGPLLCRLWQRIDQETPSSPEKAEALQEMQSSLGCAP